jgi:hypothetical protein
MLYNICLYMHEPSENDSSVRLESSLILCYKLPWLFCSLSYFCPEDLCKLCQVLFYINHFKYLKIVNMFSLNSLGIFEPKPKFITM